MSASTCTHTLGEVKENDDNQIWLDGTVAVSEGETTSVFFMHRKHTGRRCNVVERENDMT